MDMVQDAGKDGADLEKVIMAHSYRKAPVRKTSSKPGYIPFYKRYRASRERMRAKDCLKHGIYDIGYQLCTWDEWDLDRFYSGLLPKEKRNYKTMGK